jgi:hypothetical protein
MVAPPRDERRQIVEAGGELLDDAEKFECLEFGRRWFAVRTSFRSELSRSSKNAADARTR